MAKPKKMITSRNIQSQDHPKSPESEIISEPEPKNAETQKPAIVDVNFDQANFSSTDPAGIFPIDDKAVSKKITNQ